uniref:WW domain-containing protein n=1 Tax=Globodera pallida TaxID=36090 RepID=A0A183BQH1_GLOPA
MDAATADDPPVKEILWPPHGHVYEQEFMLPAYCKPKLIPLKSVTLEKLEKMQAENAEKLRKLEQEREAEEAKFKSDAVDGQSKPDIWRADE